MRCPVVQGALCTTRQNRWQISVEVGSALRSPATTTCSLAGTKNSAATTTAPVSDNLEVCRRRPHIEVLLFVFRYLPPSEVVLQGNRSSAYHADEGSKKSVTLLHSDSQDFRWVRAADVLCDNGFSNNRWTPRLLVPWMEKRK